MSNKEPYIFVIGIRISKGQSIREFNPEILGPKANIKESELMNE
jgi:hypothetical protein